MTITLYRYKMSLHANKHSRRNATAVMAGSFDPLPPRDVLTSLLNGVGRYKDVEGDEVDEEARARRKQEKKDIKREEKRKIKAAARSRQRELREEQNRLAATDPNFASTSSLPQLPSSATTTTTTPSFFWRSRPTIKIPSNPRSVSVTPSPPLSHRELSSTPASTPGPSISSSTSRTSSKRPHTPEDDEPIPPEAPVALPRPRKKRAAARKGWKGWVEGSPPPSDKLINLDGIPYIQERRTRSGRNFDGIVGNQSWGT